MNGKLNKRDMMDSAPQAMKPIMIISPQEITLLDMSFSGAGIKTEMLLEEGTELTFDIMIGHQSFSLKAEVAWSKKIGTGYRSGLKFIDLPPDFTVQVEAMLYRMMKSSYNN